MIHIHLFYAVAVGLSIAWLWTLILNTRGPWGSFFWFFVVLSMFSWLGGLWITPFGPTGWGVSWLPFVFVGACVALLLSATTPHRHRRMVSKGPATANLEEQKAEAALDLFFWILFGVLAAFIFFHYIRHPRPF